MLNIFKKNNKKATDNDIIDRPNPTREFLMNRHQAMVHVNNNFKKFAGRVRNEYEDFRWIKTDLTSQCFEDFTFAYRNRIFSVLVEKAETTQGNQVRFGNRERVERLLAICEKNNLTPCIYPVIEKGNSRVFLGMWNLIDPKTGKFVDPVAVSSDEPVEISDWELKNWAIQIVMNHVREQGLEILSYCDAPGVEPQICFKDGDGRPCWIEVLPTRYPEKKAEFSAAGFPPNVLVHDGYVAYVDFAGDEAHTSGTIIRGRGADFIFNGIEKVHTGSM